jgi:8-oxo-dGTP pyrophosphatase MutT (NUDIX family)
MAAFLKGLSRLGRWLKSWRTPVLQAGGIVIRRDNGTPKVLIVTARRRRKRWVLPKGSVQKGERAKDAALREVREEAGVTGKVICPLGAVQYTTRQGRVHCEYFLIEYRRPVRTRGEDRTARWCAIEDAISLLTYASARRVLLEAHARIVKHVNKAGGR